MKPLNLDEFNITGDVIPYEVVCKIEDYHICPMERISKILEKRLYPSLKSGYRPRWYEVNVKGRSGNSEHTFESKGATDITCSGFYSVKNKLLELLIEHSEYTRIADYGTFFHCDYKENSDGKRWLFNKDWIKQIQL